MGYDERVTRHNQFYQAVRDYFDSLGYLTASFTYHDNWDTKTTETIKQYFDPTSLYVRFRADNVAFHPDVGKGSFQWDAKTSQSPNSGNMALEIIPLLLHKIIYDAFCASCLYCYYDPWRRLQVGFWIDSIPRISRIVLPILRWDDAMIQWYRAMIERHFPKIPVSLYNKRTRGSGTPFALVNESDVRRLSHWKKCVK